MGKMQETVGTKALHRHCKTPKRPNPGQTNESEIAMQVSYSNQLFWTDNENRGMTAWLPHRSFVYQNQIKAIAKAVSSRFGSFSLRRATGLASKSHAFGSAERQASHSHQAENQQHTGRETPGTLGRRGILQEFLQIWMVIHRQTWAGSLERPVQHTKVTISGEVYGMMLMDEDEDDDDGDDNDDDDNDDH